MTGCAVAAAAGAGPPGVAGGRGDAQHGADRPSRCMRDAWPHVPLLPRPAHDVVTQPATADATPPPPDVLEVDRTALANERTLLAYLRTALQCVVAGASLLKSFDDRLAAALGLVLLALGV